MFPTKTFEFESKKRMQCPLFQDDLNRYASQNLLFGLDTIDRNCFIALVSFSFLSFGLATFKLTAFLFQCSPSHASMLVMELEHCVAIWTIYSSDCMYS